MTKKQNGKRNKGGPSIALFLQNNYLEILAAILLITGLILAFFYKNTGSILVGLASGIAFSEEIVRYFQTSKNKYTNLGLFKILIGAGMFVYFFIVLTTFILALIVGVLIAFLMHRLKKRL